MVATCCFRYCRKQGIHRLKAILSSTNSIFKIHEIPRVCKVHYLYILNCKERRLEPNFDQRDDCDIDTNNRYDLSDDEFHEVEYLEEFIHLRPRKVIEEKSETTSILPIILCKFFFFVAFCFKILLDLLHVSQHESKIIEKLQKENSALKISIKSQRMKHKNQIDKRQLLSIFTEDQLNMLFKQLKRPQNWSDKSILKSLKTKFACGSRGYTHLRREGFPYPAAKTLRTKMQGLHFEPGILDDVFLFMKEKVKSFDKHSRQCQLVIDEMSIIEGTQYDIGKQTFVGNITIPLAKTKSKGLATHLLVFIIRGLSMKYKQIVAYEFTGNSINATILRDTIFDIVKKAEAIGLWVNGVTSDMGGSNAALWSLWGIKATRKAKTIVNSIPHPCDSSRKFWIIGDVPHLLKRLVNGILNNRIVVFDDCIVKEFNLESATVKCDDFFDLFGIQKDDELKLAPKLKSHVLCPNNFQKMNVPVATNLISSNVSTALFFLHSGLSETDKQRSTYETTAWFSQVITRWFKLMTARHFSLSLKDSNYEEIAGELEAIMHIIRHSRFGIDGKWKPFQRGFLVILQEQKFEYFLTGGLTQDCVENLFSIVRSGNPKPNALQVQHAIKSISISEYLAPPVVNNTSYEWDDSEYLKDFLTIVRRAKDEHENANQDIFQKDANELKCQSLDISKIFLNQREQNVLYKVACHLLYKIITAKKKFIAILAWHTVVQIIWTYTSLL